VCGWDLNPGGHGLEPLEVGVEPTLLQTPGCEPDHPHTKWEYHRSRRTVGGSAAV
jgi:hypothetical protein